MYNTDTIITIIGYYMFDTTFVIWLTGAVLVSLAAIAISIPWE